MSTESPNPTTGVFAFRSLWLLTLLGAALLFTLEPLVAKLLIPSCGGAFHVWATCLTFFQGVLFLGYLYCLALPRIGRWHLLVLLAPLIALRVTPVGALEAEPDPASPTWGILLALTRDIGLPFFVLSTTSVATQTWLARSSATQHLDPYRLYSASNLGSLLGLLAYPLIWERFSGLGSQRIAWSLGYGVYVLLALAVFFRPLARAEPTASEGAPVLRWGSRVQWFVLSALPAAFLVSATGRLAEDLGSLPLVWVLPLVVYLGSFVVLFGRRQWLPPWAYRLAPAASALGLWAFVSSERLTLGTSVAHMISLGAICLLMHGALHAARPPSKSLGQYWLLVSLGGWVGGACATFVAPLVFNGLWDYPLCVLACWVVLLATRWRSALSGLGRQHMVEFGVSVLSWSAIAVAIGYSLVVSVSGPTVLSRLRNFYGVYRVTGATFKEAGPVRTLHHGSTVHGRQKTGAPRLPLGYYSAQGPWGHVFSTCAPNARIAIVGLGVGGLSAYSKDEGSMTYYELDPDCEVLARTWFGFLEHARGATRVVHGDARLSLSHDAEAGRYDVIVIDAFSGDAIPTHLLTREAFELYAEHLTPDGLLAVHISNRYYDLVPVVSDSRPPNFQGVRKRDEDERLINPPLREGTHLVAFSRVPLQLDALRALGWTDLNAPAGEHLWTDDHADLLGVMRWQD